MNLRLPMPGRLASWLATIVVIGLAAMCAAAEAQAPAGPAAGANASAACLQCHGPFDKLASSPPAFVAPSGEKINPHRYVPHDLAETPECAGCHRPHSQAPTAAEISALPKPNVKSCFECHHKQNFATCQSCHKRD